MAETKLIDDLLALFKEKADYDFDKLPANVQPIILEALKIGYVKGCFTGIAYEIGKKY